MHNHLDGTELFRTASRELGVHLSPLIAATTVWAHPAVFRYLLAENGLGVYFPSTRRAKLGVGERPGQLLGGVRLDSNNYANHAAKRAMGLGRGAVGFEACHIWPMSCYDTRHHTCVANLVLVPRPLAGLTDHDPEIAAALQFRAYELYGWHPPESPVPRKPEFYPSNWREPEPFTPAIRRAIERRRAPTGALVDIPDVRREED